MAYSTNNILLNKLSTTPIFLQFVQNPKFKRKLLKKDTFAQRGFLIGNTLQWFRQ